MYKVINLDTLPGNHTSAAQAINNKQQIVCTAFGRVYDHEQSFIWYLGKRTDIGNLGGMGCSASGLNDVGQVVGVSDVTSEIEQAFLWEHGVMRSLGTLGGNFSAARAINNRSQIVGNARTPSGALHAFLWEEGKMHDLSSILPGTANAAFSINATGQIVGRYGVSNDLNRSFLIRNGAVEELVGLGGSRCLVSAINDVGQIVGYANTATDSSSPLHACLWQHGKVRDLGTLGGTNSWAANINNTGQIVGHSQTNHEIEHAFVWQEGKMQDLNNLIPVGSEFVLTDAVAVNDKGEIIANGSWGDQNFAFLLVPLH